MALNKHIVYMLEVANFNKPFSVDTPHWALCHNVIIFFLKVMVKLKKLLYNYNVSIAHFLIFCLLEYPCEFGILLNMYKVS